MYYVVDMVRELFGFTRYEFIIATLGVILPLGNLIGGLLYSSSLAFGKAKRELPLKDRLTFRLMWLSLLFVILFAMYYHSMILEKITLPHVIFWIISMLSALASAFFGVQLAYVVFQNKIEARRRAYRKWQAKQCAEGAGKARDAAKMEADIKANIEKKKKLDAKVDAQIAKARKERKAGQL